MKRSARDLYRPAQCLLAIKGCPSWSWSDPTGSAFRRDWIQTWLSSTQMLEPRSASEITALTNGTSLHMRGFDRNKANDCVRNTPRTMKDWLAMPSRFLYGGGAVSDRYSGVTTVARPHPPPIQNLKVDCAIGQLTLTKSIT